MIKKCQVNKKKGYQFGSSGKCYTGRSSLAKAKKQGRAIKTSESRRKK